MTEDKDTLLNLLDKHIDLYKFHFEIAVKINLFFYGITGAILSYYFTHSTEHEQIKYALLVPVILAALLCVVLGYGAYSLKPIQQELVKIANRLDTHAVISITAIKLFLQTSVVLFFLVSVGILCGVKWA